MGYSYNGYYTRLLICEIRVRFPGNPLTPHLLNGQVTRPSIWKYGFDSRWGDYYGQLAERERRPIFVRLEHCPLMCARSGTSLDCKSLRGWFESICALMSHSSNRRGQRIPNPPIGVQVLYETSGYVAKRLCSGLLTRQTQVRPLSCPFLRFGCRYSTKASTGDL